MMWVLMSFIAIALGIILFSGIQNDIPDELGFLKAKPSSGAVIVQGGMADDEKSLKSNKENIAIQQPINIPGGWMYLSIGRKDFTVTKDMKGAWSANQPYDVPQLSLACASGKVYATILPMLRVKQDASGLTPIALNGKAFKFSVSEPLRLFAPNTENIMGELLAGRPIQVDFEYTEEGSQRFKITPEGVKDAYAFIDARCGKSVPVR